MNRNTIWIYWLATDICLGIGLLLNPALLYASMLLVVVHCIHFYFKSPHIASFPMQVRLVYLGLLVMGRLPYCSWINWVQLLGTTASLTVDYCPLARLLSLMPWNRSQPLSWQYFRKAIFSMPANGSIIKSLSPDLVTRLHPGSR